MFSWMLAMACALLPPSDAAPDVATQRAPVRVRLVLEMKPEDEANVRRIVEDLLESSGVAIVDENTDALLTVRGRIAFAGDTYRPRSGGAAVSLVTGYSLNGSVKLTWGGGQVERSFAAVREPPKETYADATFDPRDGAPLEALTRSGSMLDALAELLGVAYGPEVLIRNLSVRSGFSRISAFAVLPKFAPAVTDRLVEAFLSGDHWLSYRKLDRNQWIELLDRVSPAWRRSPVIDAAIPKILLERASSVAHVSESAREKLETTAPDWRTRAATRSAIPLLIAEIARETTTYIGMPPASVLAEIGEPAVAPLLAALSSSNRASRSRSSMRCSGSARRPWLRQSRRGPPALMRQLVRAYCASSAASTIRGAPTSFSLRSAILRRDCAWLPSARSGGGEILASSRRWRRRY